MINQLEKSDKKYALTRTYTSRKVRNEYFDFLRGIAIMMVVAIHTYPAASITGYNTLGDDILLITRQILNSAVPLFLAISGYFLARKVLVSRKEIFDFWKKQIARVYIPLLVWGAGWFLLSLVKRANFIIRINKFSKITDRRLYCLLLCGIDYTMLHITTIVTESQIWRCYMSYYNFTIDNYSYRIFDLPRRS